MDLNAIEPRLLAAFSGIDIASFKRLDFIMANAANREAVRHGAWQVDFGHIGRPPRATLGFERRAILEDLHDDLATMLMHGVGEFAQTRNELIVVKTRKRVIFYRESRASIFANEHRRVVRNAGADGNRCRATFGNGLKRVDDRIVAILVGPPKQSGRRPFRDSVLPRVGTDLDRRKQFFVTAHTFPLFSFSL